jgi:hypothetical protein
VCYGRLRTVGAGPPRRRAVAEHRQERAWPTSRC